MSHTRPSAAECFDQDHRIDLSLACDLSCDLFIHEYTLLRGDDGEVAFDSPFKALQCDLLSTLRIRDRQLLQVSLGVEIVERSELIFYLLIGGQDRLLVLSKRGLIVGLRLLDAGAQPSA